MGNYKTLHKFGVDEYIVEKSTFIGYAKPIKTEEEAIEKANEQFGSLANYTGMGGIDKIIGVPTPEDDRCIYPDSDVEFDDVQPFTE